MTSDRWPCACELADCACQSPTAEAVRIVRDLAACDEAPTQGDYEYQRDAVIERAVEWVKANPE